MINKNKLAKHGRFGDTEVVETSTGSLWHVNKKEKKLIDDYGELGESIVDAIGSGTINPTTGLEEKFVPLIAGATFALGAMESYGSTRAAREQGKEESRYYKSALEGLDKAEKSLEDSISGSLAVPTLIASRQSGQVSQSGRLTMEKARQSLDTAAASTGFAGQAIDDDFLKLRRESFENKLEDIDIGLTQNLSKILSDFEKQKLDMDFQRKQLEMQKKLADQKSKSKYFGIFG